MKNEIREEAIGDGVIKQLVTRGRSLKVRDKILFSIIPLLVFGYVLAAYLGYSMTQRIFLNDYENDKKQVADQVLGTVKLIDSGFSMLEKNMEEELENVILAFRTQFEAAGGAASKVDLTKIKAELGGKYDLAVIDSKTTIINSTIGAGLNFNFMTFNTELGKKINKIRLSDDIRHERLRTNVGTGFLSKFSYIPTKDHKFLLELIYEQNKPNAAVKEMDLAKIIDELLKNNPIITKIRIFDVYGYEFTNKGQSYKPTKESLTIVKNAMKSTQFTMEDGNLEKCYYFINLNRGTEIMADNSKIVEVVFDKTAIYKYVRKLGIYAMSAGVIIIFALAVLLYYISRRITEPITSLAEAARQVAAGDYETEVERTTNDEIGELAELFNGMIARIRLNFGKIELQKLELEDYNKNLEKKVADRTTKLKDAFVESENNKRLLEQSNLQFENLFNTMKEGFVINEIIYGSDGEPIDYQVLDANSAFERITGLCAELIQGRNAKEIMERFHSDWLVQHGIVEMSGEPYQYEFYSELMDKHYLVNVFYPYTGTFAILFSDITSQIKAREQIRKEKNILERILDETLSGYWDWDLREDIAYLSPGFRRMLEDESGDMNAINSGRLWYQNIFKLDYEMIAENFRRHVQSKGELPFYNEVRRMKNDGSVSWGIFAGHVVEWDYDDEPLQMVGCHIDITNLKNLEKSLHTERELLKATLLSISDGVISTDRNGQVNIMNTLAEKLTGWTQEEAYGKPFHEIFQLLFEENRGKCESLIEQVLKTGSPAELEIPTILVDKTGVERPVESSAAPIKGESGEINGAVLIFRDYSEKKEKLERIEFLSLHDQLTGVYNRRYLEEELKRFDTPENLPLSLVMMDVNGLKLINDAFGHITGDKVLRRVAQIMANECRSTDTIARIGGDEFVILLPNTPSSEVERIFKRIHDVMEQDSIGSLNMSVSYGTATKKQIHEKTEDIFKSAEDHMYRRKLTESKSMHYKTIEIIMRTLHEKSEREKRHSERVSRLCEEIGKAMKLKGEEIKDLITIGLMHDIGKIAIDLSILDKPGRLSDEERSEIERHPELGYQILRSINEFAKLAEYVLAHHERWDGTGYPSMLAGQEIPIAARILSIADSFDAMISDRAYRKALSREAAVQELRENAGTQFDPEIVSVFIESNIAAEIS